MTVGFVRYVTLAAAIWAATVTARAIYAGHYDLAACFLILFAWSVYWLKVIYTSHAIAHPEDAIWPNYYTHPDIAEFIDGAADIIRGDG